VDAALREAVKVRARNRCEYCRVRQEHVPYTRLQVEHIRPKKHGGDDTLANLALACDRCNFSKGPNLSGVDSETGSIVVLFNPREQRWEDHFAHRGPLIEGCTPTGRATVAVLNMNESHRVQLREELIRAGELE
jgi:hypothetical protein